MVIGTNRTCIVYENRDRKKLDSSHEQSAGDPAGSLADSCAQELEKTLNEEMMAYYNVMK
jgi:hypothetical protein